QALRVALTARAQADKLAAREAEERTRAEAKATAALEARSAAERRAEERANARAAAEAAVHEAIRARGAAADTLIADEARAAEARGRLQARAPRGLVIAVAAAIIAAVVLGTLVGSRWAGQAPLAEPLQLRLERT